jgi:hypothetical protein
VFVILVIMKRVREDVEKLPCLATSEKMQLKINSALFQASLIGGDFVGALAVCQSRWPINNSKTYITRTPNCYVPALTLWANVINDSEKEVSADVLRFLIKTNAHKDKRVNCKELLLSVRKNKWKFLSVVNTPELFEACEICRIWIQCLYIFPSTQNTLLLSSILAGDDDVRFEFSDKNGRRSLPLTELIVYDHYGNYGRLIEQLIAHIECFEMDVFQSEGGWTSVEHSCKRQANTNNVVLYLLMARSRMEKYRKHRDFIVEDCLTQLPSALHTILHEFGKRVQSESHNC